MALGKHDVDPVMDEYYLAGMIVPAGLYRLVGTNVRIFIEEGNHLPASLDGRVACYEPIRSTWHQLQQKKGS